MVFKYSSIIKQQNKEAIIHKEWLFREFWWILSKVVSKKLRSKSFISSCMKIKKLTKLIFLSFPAKRLFHTSLSTKATLLFTIAKV